MAANNQVCVPAHMVVVSQELSENKTNTHNLYTRHCRQDQYLQYISLDTCYIQHYVIINLSTLVNK